MADRILILPGDGAGPSVLGSVREIISVCSEGLEFVEGSVGRSAYEETGSFLPHETIGLTEECQAILCGPIDLASAAGKVKDPIVTLRMKMDLYAMCKHFRTLADDLGKPDVDTMLWFCSPVPGRDVVETEELDGFTLTKYVRKSSYTRMMIRAMNCSEKEHRKNVECITSSVFPESSAMFAECFRDVFGTGYFDMSEEETERWAAFAVRKTRSRGTVICADLFGRTAGGILAGLTGGNHLSPNTYFGDSVFLSETGMIGAKDPEYANPTSAVIGGCIALSDLGRVQESESIIDALCKTYRAGERTPDTGGNLTLEEFTDRIIRRLRGFL